MRHLTSKFVLGIFTSALVSVSGLLSEAQAGVTLFGTGFSREPFDPNFNLSTLYDVNPTNGVATAIGAGIGFRIVGGIDFDEFGTLYGVGETDVPPVIPGDPHTGVLKLITINPFTGVGSLVGNLGVTADFQDISFRNSDGKLYAYASGELYTINKVSGAATLLGSTANPEDGGAISFTAADTLYKTGFDHLVTLNQTNGTGVTGIQLTYPTAGTPFTTSSDYYYPTNTLYAVVHDDDSLNSTTYLSTIDTSTGTITKIGNSVIGLTGIAAIPEPSTFGVVAGVALMGIGTLGRNRRKKAVSI